MITFGPIPSRRLGRSLGINNIPPKICSYSCVYCQLGRTLKLQAERPFAFTGNAEEDLLSITSVHPMREEAVRALLEKAQADWGAVRRLIQENKLIEVEYENRKFYMRRLRSPGKK